MKSLPNHFQEQIKEHAALTNAGLPSNQASLIMWGNSENPQVLGNENSYNIIKEHYGLSDCHEAPVNYDISSVYCTTCGDNCRVII